jgi:hypothetical protein
MASLFAALLLLAQPVASEGRRVDLGAPLAGSDFLLIAAAVRHPAMRGARLACYRIFVHDERGRRQVSFVAARERVTQRRTTNGTIISYLPPDPNCRSISIEMDAHGRVARVIYSRH